MTENYEAPTVTVLGTVSDLTQGKPGVWFDFPHSAEGNNHEPANGATGTGTS
jgi:hypothetical protein